MIKFYAIRICIVLQFGILTGQASEPYEPILSDPVLEPWRWQSFPQLKGPGFRAVVEDNNGHLWFGTDEGVKRYDGMTWTNYTIKDGLHGAPINVLCAAQDGSVYAGSRKGISQFKDGVWKRIFPIDTNVDWTIWSIREAKDGTIWSGTARGALCIPANGEMCYYTTDDCAEGLRVIAPWMKYVIVPDQYVTAESWGEGIGVKEALGLPPDGGPITGAVIRAIAPGGPADRAGVRVGDRILSKDGKDGPPHLDLRGKPGTVSHLKVRNLNEVQIRDLEITKENVSGQFRDFWIFDAYPDSKGSVWFAVRTGELIKYNNSATKPIFERFDAQDGLDIKGRRPGTKLIESSDNLLWVATSSEGGLNRFDGNAWAASKLAHLGGSDLNTSVSTSPDGTIWIGGESTLHAYRNGQWTVYRAPQAPIPDGRIIVHADNNNGLWIGGVGRGISRLDLGQKHFQTYQNLAFQFDANDNTLWYLSKEGIPISFSKQWMRHPLQTESKTIALKSHLKGGVWAISTQPGIAEIDHFNNNRWQKLTTFEIEGTIRPASVTVCQAGGLWFGTDNALYKYDGQNITTYEIGYPVHAVGQDKNTIWISARTNLYKFNNEIPERIRNPEPLSRTITQTILGTREGALWIGTEFFGLFHYNGSSWNRHDIQNGLPDNNITNIAELPNGDLVISTPEGYGRYDGTVWSNYMQDVPLPKRDGLRIDSQGRHWINTADGRTICHIPDQQPPETKITVSIDKVSQPGNTVLHWEGRDPWRADHHQLQFSYQLDNSPWSPYAPITNKVFLELPSGNHTFKVRARDTDFNVDPSPALLAFQVVPPIWREPWLLFILSLLVVAGMAQSIRIIGRDRQLRDTNQDLQVARTDLERRVTLRTQELQDANEKLILEVAEREKTEREMIHLERLRAVGELSAGVSHNLNNLLTGILGPAKMVKRIITEQKGQFYIDTIIKSGERAKDLVERLHYAVRSHEQNELHQVQVNQVILDAIQTTRPRWKDEMEAQGIPVELLTQLTTVPDIRASQSGLHDTLVNLIFNAVDALPEGGTITIATSESQGRVTITVSDTGAGMDEETQKRVFEPFFTTKMDVGTGLGLFTVHSEISRWGGRINVTSTPQSGTTFTITAPAWLAPKSESDKQANEDKTSVVKSNILVIDDEDMITDFVQHELSQQHHVFVNADASDALANFEKENYQIVIIDLGLPGIPGDSLALQLKAKDPTIVTILMTGWILDDNDDRLNPFDFRIQKPLEPTDLHRTLALAKQLYDTRRQAFKT